MIHLNTLISLLNYSDAQVKEIRYSYMEPCRDYHDWRHPQDLATFAYLYGLIDMDNKSRTKILAEAILFHDIVYNPGSKTNEAESVIKYDNFRSRYFSELYKPTITECSNVIECIRRTKDHFSPIGDIGPNIDLELVEIFRDLDLVGFSLAPAEFNIYQNRVTNEYMSIYEREKVIAGQIEFLRKVLKTDRIYSTDLFYSYCENRARLNIKRWIGEHEFEQKN